MNLEKKKLTSSNLKMKNFMFKVKQFKMNKFVKSIGQPIISISNDTGPLATNLTFNQFHSNSKEVSTSFDKIIILTSGLYVVYFSY